MPGNPHFERSDHFREAALAFECDDARFDAKLKKAANPPKHKNEDSEGEVE
jgi:hypothetical protein